MPEALHVFTCAAVNYLPKVRILCRSIKKYHPEAVVHLALADRQPDWLSAEGEPFDSILAIEDLGIPNWKAWSFKHSIVELSTAIKPFALKRLLDRPGCETVLYFDPDMVLFSRVDDILKTLETANLALTPHQNKPERSIEAILDNEVASLKHGMFNLGFIGVRNTEEGHCFADWWADRLYHFCRAEVQSGLFTDQKWANFAPIYFDGVAILKSSRHNVATWNLTTRQVTGSFRDGFLVDGEPLGFYHFTGFDSGDHRIMAAKNAAASPAVQKLISWYEKEIAVADSDPISRWPWAFGQFSDGTPVERAHRLLYRDHHDLQTSFPDPYDASSTEGSFIHWCNTEGKAHFPHLFSEAPENISTTPFAPVSRQSAFRLGMLMLSPRNGAGARSRLRALLRQGGLRAVINRIRG